MQNKKYVEEEKKQMMTWSTSIRQSSAGLVETVDCWPRHVKFLLDFMIQQIYQVFVWNFESWDRITETNPTVELPSTLVFGGWE